MLVQEEGEGSFAFEPVGGIDERQLLGKPVQVGKERFPGVIGSKPIHLCTAEELHHAVHKRICTLTSARLCFKGKGG